MPTRSPVRLARKTGRQSATSTRTDLSARERDGASAATLHDAAGSTATTVPVHLLEPGGLRGQAERVAKPRRLSVTARVVADVRREIEAGVGCRRSRRRRASSPPRARARARPVGHQEFRPAISPRPRARSRFSAAMSACRSAGSVDSTSIARPVARVRKHELRRVQRLAVKSVQGLGQRRRRAAGNRETAAVHRIADERVAGVRQVQPDLVRAPRLQRDAHPGVASVALDHAVVA